MKKKRGKVSSNKTKSKNTQLKNKKNIFSSYSFWISLIILLFLVSVIVVISLNSSEPRLDPTTIVPGVTPTTSGNGIDLKAFFGNFGGDFFKVWVAGEGFNNESIAKIFLLILIWLILILVFDGIFAGQRLLIINALAFIIAFLATAYITPGEFFAILQSYSALGLTLASLIPFAVLLMLTYRAAESTSGKPQLIILQWFGWIFFTLYSLYKIIILAYNKGSWTIQPDQFITLFILTLVTLLAGFMMIFNNKLTRWLTRKFINAEGEAAEAEALRAIKGARNLAKVQRGLAGKNPKSVYEGFS